MIFKKHIGEKAMEIPTNVYSRSSTGTCTYYVVIRSRVGISTSYVAKCWHGTV